MRKIVALMAFVMVAICCQGQRFVKIGVTTNELVTMNPFDLNNVVVVKGYGATNTSDGALFQFILGDTRAANGVDVFAPSNNAGRWIMVRTASHQMGSQFMGGGTNAITLTNNLALTSLTVNSNSYITNLSVFQSFTNITDNTYISTTNYTLISTNVSLISTNITILTNTYISFGNTNYVINLFPGGGTNSVATETFVTNTILTYVVGTNLYYVFDTSQFTVAGGTNISILDGATLTNVTMRGMTVDDMLINGDWAIMTNGVNDIQWHRDALITSYPELTRQYSFDQLTLSNRRPYSVMNQADFTNIVDKMFDRTQFDLSRGWTNDATLVTPWTNWMVTIKPGAAVTNLSVYGSLDLQDGTILYTYGTAAMQVNESDFFITDGVSKNWNFKTTADANTVARISDLTSSGYSRMMEEGVNLTQRTNVNFTGLGLTVSDDAGNARTKVQVHTNLDLFVGLSSATNGFVMFNGVTPSASLRQIQAGGGITVSDGGGASGNPIVSQSASSTIQLVQVDKNSAGVVGTRSQLNFIEGGGIALTIADDPGNGEVDIQIDNTGNLYSFNTDQFNAASVTNISIKSAAFVTNLALFGTTAIRDGALTRGTFYGDSGGVTFNSLGESNLWLKGTSFLSTNDLQVGGGEYAIAVGGALAVPTHTFTNTSKTINDEHMIASFETPHGASLVTVETVTGGFLNPIYIIKKATDDGDSVTIMNGSSDNFDASGATTLVLSNYLQTAIFAYDATAGEYKVLSMYDPEREASISTLTQVTNIVTSSAGYERIATYLAEGDTTPGTLGDVQSTAAGTIGAVAANGTDSAGVSYITAATTGTEAYFIGQSIYYATSNISPVVEGRFRLSQIESNRVWIALTHSSFVSFLGSDDPASYNLVGLRFSPQTASDVNWQFCTKLGTGAIQVSNTGIPATTNSFKFKWEYNPTTPSFICSINGTAVATNSTSLPLVTQALFYAWGVEAQTDTTRGLTFYNSKISSLR